MRNNLNSGLRLRRKGEKRETDDWIVVRTGL